MSENYVKCPCQHCNKGIEFNAAGLSAGETRIIDCPHCHLETSIFVPVQAREESKKITPKREPIIKLNSVIESSKTIFKTQNMAAGAFERIVFGTVRIFTMFWAAWIVLAFILTTASYIETFLPKKAVTADEPEKTIITQIADHPNLEAFGVYLLGIFILFCALTMISMVLLLLAIERNTRKSSQN